MKTEKDGLTAFRALKKTVDALTGPNGCPWDRSQTPASLAPFLVEESWEYRHAVEADDLDGAAEELGDVLMLVLLASALAEQSDCFSLAEVAQGVNEKLIRRHPHVFGEDVLSDPEAVKQNWEAIKQTEGRRPGPDGLPRVPASFPALLVATKLGKAAAKQGFEWPDLGGPLAKISEEWSELKEAVAHSDKAAIAHEVGDLLFSITNLCRFFSLDPELALHEACTRFRSRFAGITRSSNDQTPASLADMEARWKQAKAQDQNNQSQKGMDYAAPGTGRDQANGAQ